MSVILDALSRARRENPEISAADYGLLDRPTITVPRKRRWIRRTVFTLFTLIVLGGLGVGGYFGWRAWNERGTARLYVVPSPTPLPAEGRVEPTSQQLASEPAAIPVSELRATPVATTMITISDPVPTARPQQQGLALSTPVSREVASAIGGAAAADLPPPVPISQLNPEADSSLPPPPGQRTKLPPSKNGFVLGTIIGEGDTFIAIVNGTAVRAGRSYGNFKVLKITSNEVVVQRDGEQPTVLNPGI